MNKKLEEKVVSMLEAILRQARIDSVSDLRDAVREVLKVIDSYNRCEICKDLSAIEYNLVTPGKERSVSDPKIKLCYKCFTKSLGVE